MNDEAGRNLSRLVALLMHTSPPDVFPVGLEKAMTKKVCLQLMHTHNSVKNYENVLIKKLKSIYVSRKTSVVQKPILRA